MTEQLIAVILSGFILIVNAFLFFLFNSIRIDVRDLRNAYLKAVTEALTANSELRVKIEELNGTIKGLEKEIGFLKESLAKVTIGN